MPFTDIELRVGVGVQKESFFGKMSSSILNWLNWRCLLDFQMELLSKQLKCESEAHRKRDNWWYKLGSY